MKNNGFNGFCWLFRLAKINTILDLSHVAHMLTNCINTI
ncbi:hypothetical protein GCHA_0658 [Paraglaciecola chathamensis S18K6]|uniref:Transposase n=2 Tax=Paraglaciecola chathamensis TaxID=368405 RepID=A0ABQ0I1K2_9ALTE|nr:hypothetical protein GAGA_0322 [Paraglaciecola agarilytica NO2]GAC08621.1 hypothetical protein GCHA_0658 [Paraglaciecola chathamensis S18K6]